MVQFLCNFNRFPATDGSVEHHMERETVHPFADRLGTFIPYGVSVSFCVFKEVNMKKVGIIMGSDSDLPVVRKAIDTLASFDVPYEVHIYSAHRTPVQAQSFTASARDNGFGVLICAAGMAAHLAGAVAANTTLPVIGIPMSSSNLGGMEALLSTVQMPSGIPVATVAIGGAVNAALLAMEMLAISDDDLARKLSDKRAADTAAVLAKNAAVEAEFNK